MTESQLKSIQEFTSLPIYDEHDARANALTSPHAAGGYRSIRECATLQEVLDCLKDSRLIPLGWLRARDVRGPVVVAYFGEKK
jgi:hypothetical protein